jgi:hypothetical protein
MAMNTGGSAGLTAGAGSRVSVLWPFRLAIRVIAGEIMGGALPAAPVVVQVHPATGAR